MKITCISDLHGEEPKLPGGDLLILAGDYTASDKIIQWENFFKWLRAQNYRKTIFISGNHDNQSMSQFDWFNAEYLCDSGTEFEGLKIYGSPWTKKFPGMNRYCMAYTCDNEEEMADKFEKIPPDVDILITHSPPYSILDGIPLADGSLYHAGSPYLYHWFKYVGRPKLHVFGHIHEGYGIAEVFPGYNDTMVKHVNASVIDGDYILKNEPITIEL